MEYVVKASHITKQFGHFKAVDDSSLTIKEGEIFGFIGRNGAGKTTFMKMLSGLTSPTSGEFEVFGAKGADIANQRNKIGNLIEAPGIYHKMTAKQNLHCKALAMGINKKGYEEELLKLVGLENVGRKKAGSFSLGMKQRLGIALAMVGNPKLLVLDEPINGLDPQGIVEIRETLNRLKNEKKMTIMISSHILEELSKVADTFCFIKNGRVVEQLSKEQLDQKNSSYVRIVSNDSNKVVNILGRMGITECRVEENGEVQVLQDLDKSAMMNKALMNEGIEVAEINVIHESLEEYFLEVTN